MITFRKGQDYLRFRPDESGRVLNFHESRFASPVDFAHAIRSMKKFNREANIRVNPDLYDVINVYIENGIFRKVRYDSSSDMLCMSYIPGKENSVKDLYKIRSKISDILIGRSYGRIIKIGAILNSDVLGPIYNAISQRNEVGGRIRFTRKKYFKSMRRYMFETKLDSWIEGSYTEFTVNLNDPSLERRSYISFHTHPIFNLFVNGTYVSPPSSSDYIVTFTRVVLGGEIAHIVFSPEAIYLLEVNPKLIALFDIMEQSDKLMVAEGVASGLSIFGNMFPESYPVEEISEAIRSAGGDIMRSGKQQNTVWTIRDAEGRQSRTSNFFDIINLLVSKGLIGAEKMKYKERVMRVYELTQKILNEFTLAMSLGVNFVYIVSKYGLTEDILNLPVMMNSIVHTDVNKIGNHIWSHDYSVPLQLEMNQRLSSMPTTIGK